MFCCTSLSNLTLACCRVTPHISKSLPRLAGLLCTACQAWSWAGWYRRSFPGHFCLVCSLQSLALAVNHQHLNCDTWTNGCAACPGRPSCSDVACTGEDAVKRLDSCQHQTRRPHGHGGSGCSFRRLSALALSLSLRAFLQAT